MLVTASWGGAEVAVEVDAECRSVAALKRCVQEALPELDVETVRLEVGGRSVGEEEVLGLSEGSVIDISATPAAFAAPRCVRRAVPSTSMGFVGRPHREICGDAGYTSMLLWFGLLELTPRFCKLIPAA